MMLLQSEALQIGSASLSVATFVLVLRLSFGAGRVVEKVDGLKERLDHIEEKCSSIACPKEK